MGAGHGDAVQVNLKAVASCSVVCRSWSSLRAIRSTQAMASHWHQFTKEHLGCVPTHHPWGAPGDW